MTVYAKITDNQLQCYADWAFDGHNKVYNNLTYYDDTSKYAVVDGELTDITTTEEYQQQQFEQVKAKKLLENKQALENKESLTTSFGVVKVNTPIGRVDVMATGFLNLVSITKANLPAGSFRTYTDGQETSSPEMTPEQVGAFYLEIFNKLNTLDKTYKQYEAAINSASTQEELDAIEIDYSAI